MKQYPSIPRQFTHFTAYVFDKLDGSNLRFEWSKKRGFYKFGTRHQLFDETHLQFGSAIKLFRETLDEKLSKLATDQRWEGLTAFAEFWGPNSFAGTHADEPHTLSLFDLDVYKKGLLGPKEYIKLVDDLDIPKAEFLGFFNWNTEFLENVRKGEVKCTFEGVVGKEGQTGKVDMRKAKTQKWIDAIHAKFPAEAQKLIES